LIGKAIEHGRGKAILIKRRQKKKKKKIPRKKFPHVEEKKKKGKLLKKETSQGDSVEKAKGNGPSAPRLQRNPSP